MKKLITLILLLICANIFISAQDRHELDNMRVKIETNEHVRSSRVKESVDGNKTYMQGDNSAYILSRSKALSKLSSPYVYYPIKTELSGGSYEITVGYRAKNNKNYTCKPQIIIGFDELETETVNLDYTNSVKKKKINFKSKVIRGKNHVVKIWLTTPQVEIDYIEVRRKLIN